MQPFVVVVCGEDAFGAGDGGKFFHRIANLAKLVQPIGRHQHSRRPRLQLVNQLDRLQRLGLHLEQAGIKMRLCGIRHPQQQKRDPHHRRGEPQMPPW